MTVAQAKAPIKPATPIKPTTRFDQGGRVAELARRGCRLGGVSGGASPSDEMEGATG